MNKERYLALMEKALSAYTEERIRDFYRENIELGIREHGFPRLTANIGILIAHGRRTELMELFCGMMELCCREIPTKNRANNDFSVREIICCIWELEESGSLPKETTERWKKSLAALDPRKCYDVYATDVDGPERNWALFSGVSEFFRYKAGLSNEVDFFELQFLQQQKWFDENGMYRDKHDSVDKQPLQYDLVPRGLYCIAIDLGYRGPSYESIDEKLKKAALLTLKMQSPNGEVPFGGRSNQFLHNEPWLMTIFEYEAKRYAREGNLKLASEFKSAVDRAFTSLEQWLSLEPIRHIKNRFPTETGFGCEDYAYFNKYMITAASFLYTAYRICDDSIEYSYCEDIAPCVAQTSKYFHKLFAKSGGYGLEFDLSADLHYDASGLGRIHRDGAPANVCMSCPCPSEPNYKLDGEPHSALSICSAVYESNAWVKGAEKGIYTVESSRTDTDSAYVDLLCRFPNGKTVKESYKVSKNGVEMSFDSDGTAACFLPAFEFDGENHTKVSAGEKSLEISYGGWICRYEVNGSITATGERCASRNGYYLAYLASAEDTLKVTVQILPETK